MKKPTPMAFVIHLGPSHPSGILRGLLITTLVLALSPAVHVAGARAQRSSLFAPVESSALQRATPRPPDDITIRRREVTIDLDTLAMARAAAKDPATAPAKLTLNLFDDAILTAIVNRTAPTSSGYSLSGRIENMEHGTMTLVVNGTVVVGAVHTPSGTYRISGGATSPYEISEVDESKLPLIR